MNFVYAKSSGRTRNIEKTEKIFNQQLFWKTVFDQNRNGGILFKPRS